MSPRTPKQSASARSLSFKFEPAHIEYLDRLAKRISPPGVLLSRNDAMRYLMAKAIAEESAGDAGGGIAPAK